MFRILKLEDRWTCFVCSPQPLADLFEKKCWPCKNIGALSESQQINSKKSRGKIICDDISRGREIFQIPVINEFDDQPAPLDFVYVNKPVGGGVAISNNPNFISCCNCKDNCKDPLKCQCALLMNGFAYDDKKKYDVDKPSGVYECNFRCSCHIQRCKNRLVGNGPFLPLEIFRCDSSKGWGVRCAVDVYAGTFVADYIGEIMNEEDAENRGLLLNDEYLFTLDKLGRSQACGALCNLGMKRGLSAIPRQSDIDISTTDDQELRGLFGSELTDLLHSKGAIERANGVVSGTEVLKSNVISLLVHLLNSLKFNIITIRRK
jgi:hypothetical protein